MPWILAVRKLYVSPNMVHCSAGNQYAACYARSLRCLVHHGELCACMFAKLATFGVRFRHFPRDIVPATCCDWTTTSFLLELLAGRSSLLARERHTRLEGHEHVFAVRSDTSLV